MHKPHARPARRPPFVVEAMESRLLLTAAGGSSPPAAGPPSARLKPADSMPSYVVTLLDYPDENAPTVAGGTTEDVLVTVTPFDDEGATTPTGDVVVGWDGGPQYTVPITPTANGTGPGTATTSLVFAPGTSGTPLSAGGYKGSYVLSAYYTGGNYPATSPLTGSDYAALNAAPGNTAVTLSTPAWKLVYYAGTVTPPPVTDASIAFAQQPQDLATGDTFDPGPTVDLFTADGSIDTASTAAVTLALASGDDGTLGGTTTVNAVAGVATFGKLTITGDGTYSLSATSGADNAVSQTFTVSPGKLVFTKAPHDGTAGDPLDPAVVVTLEDATGKVATDDSSSVVTLATVGVTGGAPVTGNTATLVDGVATFPALSLTKPGFYQLQATDGGDAQATSGKFKVTGDHLAFLKQPANADPNTPVPLTVEILDTKNKLVTDATSSIALSLNTVSGGTNAALTGTTLLAFAGGVATFTPTAGPTINVTGTYTLTATEEDAATGTLAPTNTTAPLVSHHFSIAGLHLVFDRKPPTTDVTAPLLFAVAAENAKGKVQSDVTGGISLGFTRGTGATGTLSPYTDSGFVNGVDTFTATNAASFNYPGAYTLSASPIDQSGAAVTTTAPASAPLKILGLHIKFLEQPQDTPIQANIAFKVEIVNAAGKIDTNEDGDEVSVKSALNGNPSFSSGLAYSAGHFSGGVLTFLSTTPSVLTPGSTIASELDAGNYTLTVGAQFSAFMPDIAVEPATSKSFKVSGLHIAFLKQPSNTTVNDALPFTVALEDDKDHVDTMFDEDYIQLSTQDMSGLGYSIGHFDAGVRAFPNAITTGILNAGAGAVTYGDAGMFSITATAVSATAVSASGFNVYSAVPDVAAGTSTSFKVFNQHIGFVRQPTVSGGNVLFFQLAVEDEEDKVYTGSIVPYSFTVSYVPVGANASAGTTVIRTTSADPDTGIASFTVLAIPQGKYKILAVNASGNTPALSDADSNVFTIV